MIAKEAPNANNHANSIVQSSHPGFLTTQNLEIRRRPTNIEHIASVAADTPITNGPRVAKSPWKSFVAIMRLSRVLDHDPVEIAVGRSKSNRLSIAVAGVEGYASVGATTFSSDCAVVGD
jgi:hypothetical protein